MSALSNSDAWAGSQRENQSANQSHRFLANLAEAHNLYYTGKYDEVIARGRDEIHRWQEMTEDRLKI